MPEEAKTLKKKSMLEELMEQDPMVKSGVKKLQKSQDEHIEEAVQAGVPYQDILKQLIQISNIKQPVVGTMKGPLAIADLLSGKGFHPLAPQEEPLGIETAAKVMTLGQSAEKMPYEIASTQADLLKKVMELTGINPVSGKNISDIEAESAAKKEAATVRARKEEESKIRTEEFAQELSNYFEIGDLLPTSEGLSRFKTGFELFGKSIGQSDFIGAAAADLGKINKRIRVKLVRQAGDVGNLNIVEQKAAEELLYNLDDSTQLRAIKKAFLTDLNRATTDKSPSAVRKLISEWVNRPEFKDKYPDLYKKYTKQREGKESTKYVRTGTNKKGQKVGQLADGTVEVINE